MAMSPAAKALKDRMKSKSKSKSKKDDAPKGDDKKEAKKDEAGGTDVVADFDAAMEEVRGDKGKDVEVEEGVAVAAEAGPAGGMGDDPVKTFGDILDLDDITAQAVYAEAMAMPELADMDAKQMAEKIKGNYDLLKAIIVSMGEKAAMAMKNELNQPMAPPEMGGAPDMGPDMGGPPMGPGMSGPPMA